MTNKYTILAVEDDATSQSLLRFYLQNSYKLHFADSVDSAREILDRQPVDLILLDLSLAGDEDGLDLVRSLRPQERWKNLPILAVTAHAFTSDRDNCLEAGCTDFLSKPVGRHRLLEKIATYLK